MSYQTNPSAEYLRNLVLTASPEQLQLMLYDGAIRYATDGRDSIEKRDRAATFEALDRAQRIVLELMNGVNRDVNQSLADRMLALYHFVYRRLIDANLELDLQAVDDALRILKHQRETWLMLMEKVRTANQPEASPGDQPAHLRQVGSRFTRGSRRHTSA